MERRVVATTGNANDSRRLRGSPVLSPSPVLPANPSYLPAPSRPGSVPPPTRPGCRHRTPALHARKRATHPPPPWRGPRRRRSRIAQALSDFPLVEAVPMNSGIVASPSALIPSRFSTFHAVRTRIFRSSKKDRLSTYQTSRANFSSQVIAFRPLTCAQPVRPGLTSWRRACSGSISAQVLRQQRARTHQAHVPLQHVEQLRQFVQAPLPHPAPQRRHALGVRQGPPVAPIGASHCTELVQPEKTPIQTGAILEEQTGSPHLPPDQKGQYHLDRKQQEDQNPREQDVQEPFQDRIQIPPALTVRESPCGTRSPN